MTDDAGQPLNGERGANATVRVTPAQPLVQGQTYTWTFTYSGAITTADGGPVEGLKLASIADPVSYLLYAGRWFPMTGYQTDRFTADIHLHVPSGYTVIGSGITNAPRGPVTTVTAAQARADEKKDAPAGAAPAGEPILLKRPSDSDAPDLPAPAVPATSAAASAKAPAAGTTSTRSQHPTAARARAAGRAAKPAADTAQAPATAATPASFAGTEYDFHWDKPGFPGTLIIGKFAPPVSVAGSPNIKVYALPGTGTAAEARKQATAAYAETANQEFAFFTSTFGLPESSRLNVVELPNDTVPCILGARDRRHRCRPHRQQD